MADRRNIQYPRGRPRFRWLLIIRGNRGTDNPFCPHESKKAKECFSLLTFHLPLKKNGGEGGIAALSLTLIALVRRYRTSLKRAVALREYA